MTPTLRLLQVEDSESDAAMILRALDKAGYRVAADRVETADEMRAALAREQYHLVLADYQLPQFDAPEALAVLQESGQDLPFIVVSGMVGEDAAVAMMKHGAHDYLMKGSLARLAPAVERELREARSRREARSALERAEAATRAEQARFRALVEKAADGIRLGSSVRSGQVIAYVGKMFHLSMLHFELYSGTGRGPLTDRSNKPFQRRGDLIDLGHSAPGRHQ